MKNRKEILNRYYRGESSVEEERMLKQTYRQGMLPDEPILAYKSEETELPEELARQIRQKLRQRQTQRLRTWTISVGSIAALLVLLISLRSLLPLTEHPDELQLSDNLKKERFEEALRVIGHVLEEQQTPPVQKVLYEDHKLIITVE